MEGGLQILAPAFGWGFFVVIKRNDYELEQDNKPRKCHNKDRVFLYGNMNIFEGMVRGRTIKNITERIVMPFERG
ncbi:hypothetical protein [uncultured Paenibacillus sp.]|uniref:hypothetical protein n=1 Tax=uncultured Paenibacillus sp. TaxID=227322 RepID=UPI0015B37967|nr:hypothetical protein [uncultured Paenibacillus sp.]